MRSGYVRIGVLVWAGTSAAACGVPENGRADHAAIGRQSPSPGIGAVPFFSAPPTSPASIPQWFLALESCSPDGVNRRTSSQREERL